MSHTQSPSPWHHHGGSIIYDSQNRVMASVAVHEDFNEYLGNRNIMTASPELLDALRGLNLSSKDGEYCFCEGPYPNGTEHAPSCVAAQQAIARAERPRKNMIEIVTFTGVDARTSTYEMSNIISEYPFVEFGILAGSQTGGSNPIFPDIGVLDNFRRLIPRNHIAIHLCGKFAREAVGQEPGYAVYGLSDGFGRIQINLHHDIDSSEGVSVTAEGILDFVQHTAAKKIIIQHRDGWDNIPVMYASKIEYLFDRSEGAGSEGFDQWPAPSSEMRVGYAGGLGPHNIDRAIEFANKYPNNRIWFDMERNVRDHNYQFDLDKVRAVCERVAEEIGYAQTS